MLSRHKTSPFSPPLLAHLQHKDLSGGFVDVKLRLVGPVGVDALAGEEVDNVLRTVLVTVGGSDLVGTDGDYLWTSRTQLLDD